MNLIIPSWSPTRAYQALERLQINLNGDNGFNFIPVVEKGLGCLSAMAKGANCAKPGPLFFIHDDTYLLDAQWLFILENFFKEHPKCGLVGLGGAKKFGAPEIYKVPYKLMQLIRYDFVSNMEDWKIHGTLATQHVQVAFVDGFALCFRREAYDEMGGWLRLKEHGLPEFHGYDMLSCIEMHRLGWEVWMVPIKCHHEGGKTSTSKDYEEFVLREGFKSGQELFEKAHRVCYERGRGVLPWWIK